MPTTGKIIAPCDGTISNTVNSKHAIGITTENNIDLLIHVGLETVNLKGKYFEYKVELGQKVKVGDTLIEFNLEKIKSEGYNTVTPIVISSDESYSKLEIMANGKVSSGDDLLNIIL